LPVFGCPAAFSLQIEFCDSLESEAVIPSYGPGSPPLPTRLMAGIAILKYMHDLSDEAVCDHWVENPYFQFFCGEEFFQCGFRRLRTGVPIDCGQ
jgi:Transposase domain (DUF772)